MPAIPLQKFREVEYPLTPKSTIHHWAVQGYYHHSGPLAGKVKKEGGRWYVQVGSKDPVVESIVATVKDLLNKKS